MALRTYVSIATLFSVVLSFPSSGTSQENLKKASGRPASSRRSTPADAELARLRADVVEKMKESRASAEKLLGLHEEERKKLNEDY
jgi:hypothetical protein